MPRDEDHPLLDTNNGGGEGKGTFSCFHGEEALRPPVDMETLEDYPYSTFRETMAEAERRLPLPAIPDLASCVRSGGASDFGLLADPVANVILNAISLLHRDLAVADAPRPPPPMTMEIIRCRQGLAGTPTFVVPQVAFVVFMVTYFRHLTGVQARRCLSLSGYNLRLAIDLVHHDRRLSQLRRRRLLPDGGRMEPAHRVAAAQGGHPAPDVLARVMTAEYPAGMLAVAAAKIRGTEALSADDVWEIMDPLDRQWPPPRVVVNISIDKTSTLDQDHQDQDHSNGDYITDMAASGDEDLRAKLSMCQEAVSKAKPRLLEQQEEADHEEYDTSPCEHMVSMKLQLLDAIHGFYIKALTAMPMCPRRLLAVLVAGHCYGAMEDPVSNIIVNSIWYKMAFLLAAKDDAEARTFPRAMETRLPDGILDTKLMQRVESRSLDGLIAIVGHSKHRVLGVLNSCNCKLPVSVGCDSDGDRYFRAAQDAKHPQHAVFGSFIVSMLSLSSDELSRLRSYLPLPGERFSTTNWGQLVAMLSEKAVSKFHHIHPNVYHVNFLAGTDDVAAKDERKLFFAELWEPGSANPSICCPVNDCGEDVGPCSFCEEEGSKIGLMDADYVYFDPDRDVELAKIINDVHEKKAIAWSRFFSERNP
ncbi:hypothetical protein HU200_015805 [Digitaria exilis]|uniref:Uncharacterized protein n=1 Tax=Digitaria exilis TaxID=1010633 RepID=A0A835KHK6_9POAL|nr:hypothetical protein HU200_015805 [Digitaria exilis]